MIVNQNFSELKHIKIPNVFEIIVSKIKYINTYILFLLQTHYH